MSTDLEEFFARARGAADSIAVPVAAEARRRGERRRRRQTAVVVCSVFAIVAASLGTAALTARDRKHPDPAETPGPIPSTAPQGFAPLQRTGTPLGFGAAGHQGTGLTLVTDSGLTGSGPMRGFGAWRTQVPDALVIAGIDLRSGRVLWGPTAVADRGEWEGLSSAPEYNVLAATRFATDSTGDPVTVYFFDTETGRALWYTTDRVYFIADGVVITAESGDLVGRDLRTGRRLWHHATSATHQGSVAPFEEPVRQSNAGVPVAITAKMTVLDSAGRLDIFNAHKGFADPARTTADLAPGSYVASATAAEVLVNTPVGRPLEVTGVAEDGQTRSIYKGRSITTALVPLRDCYSDIVCLIEGNDLVAVTMDAAPPEVAWRTDLGFEPYSKITWAGPGYTVIGGRRGEDSVYAVVDSNGHIVTSYTAPQDQHVDVVREGVVLGPIGNTERPRPLQFTAVTRDGTAGSLGQIVAAGQCSAGDDVLLCLDDSGVTTWSFH